MEGDGDVGSIESDNSSDADGSGSDVSDPVEEVDLDLQPVAVAEDAVSSQEGDDADAQVPQLQAYSQELHLTDDDLEAMGHFAHAVQQALQMFRTTRRKDKIRSLGFHTVADAKRVFSLLGRKGRMPWSAPYFKHNMPYIRSSALILLPPAHMLLHGLCKTFLAFSFGKFPGWKTQSASEDRPLLLSKQALDCFKVRFSP
ncbi:MAG: hypothetical protein HC767_00065 [Akkermansiaceae bacterium]|nr:hypothetical protein [Akkermansiaceae bacterium]